MPPAPVGLAVPEALEPSADHSAVVESSPEAPTGDFLLSRLRRGLVVPTVRCEDLPTAACLVLGPVLA